MKKLLFSLLLLSACISAKGPLVPNHNTLLPMELRDTYLGMELPAFEMVRNTRGMERSNLMEFRIQFVEAYEGGDLKEVTYYFDNEGKFPLYEYIIEYMPGVDVRKRALDMYGPPNNGNEWIFDSGEGFNIKIWTFDAKIVIAGVLPNTEWAE
jgi:hypothetical protein